MVSAIDPTLPIYGTPTTISVRNNFSTAKNEITALQANTTGAPFLPIAGGNVTGNLRVGVPTDAGYKLDITGTTRVTGLAKVTALQETRVAMAANNIDLSAGAFYTKTITANTTFTVTNMPLANIVPSFILELTNGGAFTITWWAGMTWQFATPPVLTASGVDALGFYTLDGGTTWRGMLLSKAMG